MCSDIHVHHVLHLDKDTCSMTVCHVADISLRIYIYKEDLKPCAYCYALEQHIHSLSLPIIASSLKFFEKSFHPLVCHTEVSKKSSRSNKMKEYCITTQVPECRILKSLVFPSPWHRQSFQQFLYVCRYPPCQKPPKVCVCVCVINKCYKNYKSSSFILYVTR